MTIRASTERRLPVIWCAVACALVGAVLEAAPPQSRAPRNRAEDLANGIVLTVPPKRNVGAILDQLRRAYPARVDAVDQYGKRSRRARALPAAGVSAQKEPFWELIRKIQKATGLKLKEIDDTPRLQLAEEYFGDDKIVAGGDTVVSGAFLVEPIYDTFFKRPELRIWAEPWLKSYSLAEYTAKLTLPGGEVVERSSKQPTILGPNGAMSLALRLDEGVEKAAKIELSAVVDVPIEGARVQSPPLADLTAKPVDLGALTFRAVEFRNVVTDDGDRLSLRFEVEGVTLGKDDVRLIGPDGKTVPSRSFETYENDHREAVDVEYDPADAATLDEYRLELSASALELVKVGKVGDFEKGKGMKVGLVELKLMRLFETDMAMIVFACRGGSIPAKEIFLRRGNGEPVRPHSQRGFVRKGVQQIDLEFLRHQTRPSIKDYTLYAKVATAKKAYTVKEITKHLPTPFQAGAATVTVLGLDDVRSSAGGTVTGLRLAVEGARLEPEDVKLLDRRRRPLGHGGTVSSSSKRQLLTLEYSPAGIKKAGRLESFRLLIDAPGGVLKHTLTATLTDVLLGSP